MAKRKSSLMVNCLVLLLAVHKKAQAQVFPFSLGGSGSDNECYLQCPMECPQLNLNMVDCVVYCKMKCACAADVTGCITEAMDKLRKAADERESPESDAPSSEPDEEATDADFAFAAEDGEQALPPGAMEPEIDTTSSVIDMDPSPASQDAEAPAASEGPEAAAPQSAAAAATPQSAAAPTPTPQGALSPAPQTATAASPAPQNAALPAQQTARAPAPTPA